MGKGTVPAAIVYFQESYNRRQQDDRRLDEKIAGPSDPCFVQIEHRDIGRFIGVGDIAHKFRIDRIASMAASGVIEIQHVEFRRNGIVFPVAQQMIIGYDAQVRELEVIDIHGKALLDLLPDEIVDHGIGLPGTGCAEDRCRTEWIDDIDPPVVHPALIQEFCGQVDRVFIGQQPCLLQEGLVLVVEHVLHHIILQKPAGPHPGSHEEHVSGPERRDIEDSYHARGGAQVEQQTAAEIQQQPSGHIYADLPSADGCILASPDTEARESEEQQCEKFRMERRGVETRALLEVQQDPVDDAERSAQRIKERVTEIIDVRQQYDDAERPHEVEVLFQSYGFVG